MKLQIKIPQSTTQLFLPLYLHHPAVRYLVDHGIAFSGISKATQGFSIHRPKPDFHLALFTTAGAAQMTCQGERFELLPDSLLLTPADQSHRYAITSSQPWEFTWFHIAPTEHWRFIDIQRACLGKQMDIVFITNAIRGFVSEIFTILPQLDADQNERQRYVDSPDLHQSMSAFDIPEQSTGQLSMELSDCYGRLILNYLERELRTLLECDGNANRYHGTFEQLWKQVRSSLNQPWTLEDMASAANVSVPTFIRHIKEIYHCTPASFLQHLRLTYACRLLAESRLPISEIAQNTGYQSISSFAALFKKKFQLTPREYRNRFQYRNL